VFEDIHVLGLAATFLASLFCGFVGAACVFRLAINLLVVAAGESLDLSSDRREGRPLWTWPRDRGKIVAVSLVAVMIGAVFFGLSYVLATRAFHGVL
jgi:hypothetical protein